MALLLIWSLLSLFPCFLSPALADNECGTLTNALSGGVGTLSLPTSCSGSYCPSLACLYQLCAPSPFVYVNVTSIDIEPVALCTFDYLMIANNKFCGNVTPAGGFALPTMQGCAAMSFHSDAADQRTGFTVNFYALWPNMTACSSQPCLNGGSCIPNHDLLTFTCVCTALYTGTYCQTHARCGPSLITQELLPFSLPKPCSQGRYCPNTNCQWTVCLPATFEMFAPVFSLMSIENHATCVFDWVKFGTGPKLCGSTIPDPVYVTANDSGCFSMQFGSDSSVEMQGFTLTIQGVDHCVVNICQNGGTCVALPEGDTCNCPTSFTGVHCETPYSTRCGALHYSGTEGSVELPDNCGSTCNNLNCLYTICTGGPYALIDVLNYNSGFFVNPLARVARQASDCMRFEINDEVVCLDDFGSDPRLFGAATAEGCLEVSLRRGMSYGDPGLVFTYQAVDETTCWSGPCQNGGRCIPAYNSFTCECPETFQGLFCQTEITTTTVARVTQPQSAGTASFLESTTGIVVVCVCCLVGVVLLLIGGCFFYKSSARSNRVMPFKSTYDPYADEDFYMDRYQSGPVPQAPGPSLVHLALAGAQPQPPPPPAFPPTSTGYRHF